MLVHDGGYDADEAAPVIVTSGVEPERLFVEVAGDMERLDAHIRPTDGTLEQGPEILDPVRVDTTANVLVKSRVVCKSERKLLDASVRLPWRPPWAQGVRGPGNGARSRPQ